MTTRGIWLQLLEVGRTAQEERYHLAALAFGGASGRSAGRLTWSGDKLLDEGCISFLGRNRSAVESGEPVVGCHHFFSFFVFKKVTTLPTPSA
jgi:hypothetical protein